MWEVEFADSAFRHKFHEEDFFELLSGKYIKLKSQRGISDVFELLGQNLAGDNIHVIYRIVPKENLLRVFHMTRMTERQKKRFQKWIKK
jgi:hypothetical protein